LKRPLITTAGLTAGMTAGLTAGLTRGGVPVSTIYTTSSLHSVRQQHLMNGSTSGVRPAVLRASHMPSQQRLSETEMAVAALEMQQATSSSAIEDVVVLRGDDAVVLEEESNEILNEAAGCRTISSTENVTVLLNYHDGEMDEDDGPAVVNENAMEENFDSESVR